MQCLPFDHDVIAYLLRVQSILIPMRAVCSNKFPVSMSNCASFPKPVQSQHLLAIQEPGFTLEATSTPWMLYIRSTDMLHRQFFPFFHFHLYLSLRSFFAHYVVFRSLCSLSLCLCLRRQREAPRRDSDRCGHCRNRHHRRDRHCCRWH